MRSILQSWRQGCARLIRVIRSVRVIRMIRLCGLLVAVCLGWHAVMVAATEAHPSSDGGLEPLAGLHEEVVLQGVTLNDRRLDLNRFVDHRPPHLLREMVRTLWSRRPAPVHALEREGWLVLVQAVGTSVETMELRARGAGTEGRRARLSPPDPDLVETAAWLEGALPAGCRVLRRITHRDGERRLTTLVAVCATTAAGLSHRLLSVLQRHGFRQPPRATPSFDSAAGSLQFLSRGREELALAIIEQAGERAVVLHWGRADR
jgi:hypothetical protein